MRVSSSQLMDLPQRTLREAGVRQLEASRQITDGLRFNRASGGPAALNQVSRIDQASSVSRTHQANIDALEARLSMADVSLGAIGDSLLKVKELLVQSRNGALGPSERAAIQGAANLELEAVANELGRRDAQGRAVFVAEAPAEAGLEIRSDLQIEPWTVLSLTTSGGRPLADAIAGGPVIDLVNGGNDAAARYMDTVDRWLADATAARSDVGRRWDLIDRTRDVQLAVDLSRADARSTLIDADIATASTDLAKAGAQLQAAQLLFARIETGGLFAMLR